MCYSLLRLCPFAQFPLLQKDHFLSPAIFLWVRWKVAPVQSCILLFNVWLPLFYVCWIHTTTSAVSRHVLLGLSFLPGGWEHYPGWCDSSNFLQRLLGVYHIVAKKEENMAVLSLSNCFVLLCVTFTLTWHPKSWSIFDPLSILRIQNSSLGSLQNTSIPFHMASLPTSLGRRILNISYLLGLERYPADIDSSLSSFIEILMIWKYRQV